MQTVGMKSSVKYRTLVALCQICHLLRLSTLVAASRTVWNSAREIYWYVECTVKQCNIRENSFIHFDVLQLNTRIFTTF